MNPEKPIFLKTATTSPQDPAGTSTFLIAANNLGDLTDVTTARANLGLGTSATFNSTAFDMAGAAAAARAAAIAYANALFAGGTTPTGPAGGQVLAGTYPNPISNISGSVQWSIVQATRFTLPLVTGYPGTGTCNLNLTGQNNILISITGTLNIVDAASTAGMVNIITVRNTSGSSHNVTWPAWLIANGYSLPSSIANGEAVTFWLQSDTTIPNSVVFYSEYSAPSISVPLTGPLNSRLRKNTAGTIASSADMTWSGPDWFNVADYGAIPNIVADWSPQINACVAAAVAYATTNGTATVFFPQGVWYVSAEILATMGASGNICIRGTGRLGTMVVQQTALANGIHVNLSNGGGGAINNRAEVCHLTLKTTAGLSAGIAVLLDYGPSTFNPRFNQGSAVHDVMVSSDDAETGGFTDGVLFKNCWASKAYNLDIYGGQGWDMAATPGAGGAGVGSGRALAFWGGTNQQIDNVYTQTWSQAFGLLPVDGPGGSGLVPQGVHFTNIDNVNCIEFMHGYANSGGAGADSVTVSCFQCDNGNNVKAGRWCFFFEGGVFGMRLMASTGCYLAGGGDGFVKLNGFSASCFSNIQWNTNSAVTYALWLTGTSNGNIFDGCSFGGYPIQMDAAAGLNQINNTGASVITNAGAGNRTLTTLF